MPALNIHDLQLKIQLLEHVQALSPDQDWRLDIDLRGGRELDAERERAAARLRCVHPYHPLVATDVLGERCYRPDASVWIGQRDGHPFGRRQRSLVTVLELNADLDRTGAARRYRDVGHHLGVAEVGEEGSVRIVDR